jgi:hypothetical protein
LIAIFDPWGNFIRKMMPFERKNRLSQFCFLAKSGDFIVNPSTFMAVMAK